MDERKLIMTFKNTLGNSFSITIDDPREDIEETDKEMERFSGRVV